MRRRRPWTMRRRFRSSLFRLLAIGVLILWIILLVRGILNYQQSTDAPGPRVSSEAPLPQASQRAGTKPSAPSLARRGASPAHGHKAPSAARNTTARAKHQKPPAASIKPESQHTVTEHNAAEPSDIAQLETERTSGDTMPDQVVQAQFTTGIVNQRPINSIQAVFSMRGRVYSLDGRPVHTLYYFTEIRGMRGEIVTHRWERNNQLVMETPFKVSGDPWLIYSHQDLAPGIEGNWRVVVTDAQGDVIKTDSFSFQGF
jgi:hypothetical protein